MKLLEAINLMLTDSVLRRSGETVSFSIQTASVPIFCEESQRWSLNKFIMVNDPGGSRLVPGAPYAFSQHEQDADDWVVEQVSR